MISQTENESLSEFTNIAEDQRDKKKVVLIEMIIELFSANGEELIKVTVFDVSEKFMSQIEQIR